MPWNVQCAPSRTSWHVYFSGRLMATIDVLVPLEHEHAVMARIGAALNKQHEGTPERTWTARPEGHTSWYLLHNGRVCAGIVWHCIREDLATGTKRVLEGLNCAPSPSLPAAEPARPTRHLRLVS